MYIQLKYIPQMHIAYIQYKCIFLKMYIPQPAKKQGARSQSKVPMHPSTMWLMFAEVTNVLHRRR